MKERVHLLKIRAYLHTLRKQRYSNALFLHCHLCHRENTLTVKSSLKLVRTGPLHHSVLLGLLYEFIKILTNALSWTREPMFTNNAFTSKFLFLHGNLCHREIYFRLH